MICLYLIWTIMPKTCPTDRVSSEMVYVSKGGFCLDAHEVTNAAYQSCVEAGFCDLPSDTEIEGNDGNPVTNVNWVQANDYCRELVEKRLPTRSEWGQAAENLTDKEFEDLNGNVKEWLDESEGDNLKVIKTKEFTGEKFTSAPLNKGYNDVGFRCAVNAEFRLPWPFQ